MPAIVYGRGGVLPRAAKCVLGVRRFLIGRERGKVQRNYS